MKPPTLLRKLTRIVVIKLLLLTLIWWGFIRDVKVETTPQSVATAILALPEPANPPGSQHHGQ